jgi:hypothetical protein
MFLLLPDSKSGILEEAVSVIKIIPGSISFGKNRITVGGDREACRPCLN